MRVIFISLPFLLLSLQSCFFPNNSSELAHSKEVKRVAQMAAPLIQHMKVTLNGQELTIRNNASQMHDESIRATLTIVPLSKNTTNHVELPCVAGFLRVDNLSDITTHIESGAEICYESPKIESQLHDANIRVRTSESQTCLYFDNVRDLSPKGESGDFASIVWYVCEQKPTNNSLSL